MRDALGVAPRRILTGWGRTAPSAGTVVAPRDADELAELLGSGSAEEGAPRAVIARGLGRSYGDAAQCGGGIIVDTSHFDSIGPVDRETGTVEVGGGVSLHALMQATIPLGWFVSVTPGTRQVTVGGAIAADVHGKNHHCDGSFCSYVTSLTLATPLGTRTVTPTSDPELFWATAGGMGLTGIIVKATLRLTPVETGWVEVDTERFGDIDATMSAMDERDRDYRYSVAWIDCAAHNPHMGRSVVTWGDHAPMEALTDRKRASALTPPREPRVSVPFAPPGHLVNTATIRAFNELWFRKAPRRLHRSLVTVSGFFHPLDGVAEWNLLYGKGGFVQHQMAVSPRHGEVVRSALSAMAQAGIASSMVVLKRFGPGNPGFLSFPAEGWTLALDFPATSPGLPSLLDRLDELVLGAGGRIYLAKDARLRPEHLREMYPKLNDLERVRDKVDPERVLQSDLSRRLAIGRKKVS